MSGFDEEAERERLREKYEQDQEKRAATQRMSELLLKGATMTNSHCDACGDPLFRHDGQTFCPTCQGAEQGAGEASGEASDQASTESPPEPASESPPPAAADADAQATDPETATPDRPAPSSGGGERPADTARDPAPRTHQPSTADANGASLDDARASLSRTLVRYARAAEETDDPRRATELLGAAREAAETLAALDRR